MQVLVPKLKGSSCNQKALVMLQLSVDMSNKISMESVPRIRVVIVEKHPAVRRALRKRLDATSQLDVIATFQDPNEALSFLNCDGVPSECRTAADVILLGLQNETDEELYKTLNAIRTMVNSPAAVIVLAPFADEVERLLMKQAGVSSYLLKYIDSRQLILEIEAVSNHNSASLIL